MGGWTAVSSIPKQKSMHKRFLCATVSNNGNRRGVHLFLFFLIAINLSIRAESFSSVVDYFSSGRGRGRGQDDFAATAAVPTARLLQQIQRLNLSTLPATVHH